MSNPSELMSTLGINTADGKIVYTTEEFWLLKDAVTQLEAENERLYKLIETVAADDNMKLTTVTRNTQGA